MKTLARQVKLLHALAGAPPEGTSVRHLARVTGMAPSSTHRLLNALVDVDLAMQNAQTQKYRLGYGVLRLASSVLGSTDAAGLIAPYLQWLTESSSFLSFAAVWTGSAAVCVATQEPDGGGSFFVQVGRTLPLHAAAGAKALICRMSDGEKRQLLESSDLQQYTARTRTSVEDVLEDLRRGMARGYWESDDELDAGVYAVAAPVLTPTDVPVMSLTLLCARPASAEARTALAAQVMRVAAEASRDVGPLLAAWNRTPRPERS